MSIVYLVILSFLAYPPGKSTVKVQVNGLDAKNGKVLAAVYNEDQEFLSEQSFRVAQGTVTDGTAVIVFDNIPYGKYAMSLFFDENANEKLDKNFIGIPKEPYAFSNNPRVRFGPPSFQDAMFIVSNEQIELEVRF